MKKLLKYTAVLLSAGLLSTACSLDEENPAVGDATLDNFNAWYGLQSTCYSPLNDQIYTA